MSAELAVEVHRHEGLHPRAAPAMDQRRPRADSHSRAMSSANRAGLEVEGRAIDVAEERPRAERAMVPAVAKKVKGEVITASPGPMPSAMSASSRRIGPGGDADAVLDTDSSAATLCSSSFTAARG